MSTSDRYKTLIPFLTDLYVSDNTASRTNILRDGLLALCSNLNNWAVVRKDAERLLRVWSSKESDPAAREVVEQTLSVLSEFVNEDTPRLVITEEDSPIQHVQAHPGGAPKAKALPEQTPTVFVTPIVDEEEEEVEEEEEEEEEEEGMEVEKRKIRGRVYWFEATTQKLYAVTADDEVGDEVGILLANGNPLLLTPV